MNIKANLLLLTAILMLNCKSNKSGEEVKEIPKTFTLNASIEGLESDYLVYYEKDDKDPSGYHRDTLGIKDQKFTFKDSIEGYKLYYIGVPEALRSYKVKVGDKEYQASVKAHLSRLWFIGFPGAKISYNGKIVDYMVDAYPSDSLGINNDLALINSQIFPLLNTMDSISVAISTSDLNEEEVKSLYERRDKLSKEVTVLKTDFIKSHPKSIAASYVFNDAYYRRYFTHEEAKALFNGFDSSTLDGTPFYEEAKERISAVENTGIGMSAPELTTLNTLNGKEFKLSELKGNYVLLDYWGTWCGPCMAEIPKIKEYSQKYANKNFTVVGVNQGDTDKKWRDIIEKENYDWTHIRSTNETNLLIPFNVNSFPTKIVLDPKGKIIYSSKNPEKVDMYQMLDDIFSTK
ncbi:TlpA disulfide reductase family protein [Mangrovimonas sp. ST2L15]|uniref:TlpA disulfide reductase family protein n=1 Tax=Mangrovimonas sp. ST2L15 TaxID=1645916 RepID=UPI0006B405D1|nr:TlpA disulfide reductase family protein [Mangrovimonas sp. ST2L15]